MDKTSINKTKDTESDRLKRWTVELLDKGSFKCLSPFTKLNMARLMSLVHSENGIISNVPKVTLY